MFIHRINQADIERSFETSYITIILGPRRVGKTTLIKAYAQAHPQHSWVFLNMDNLLERNRIDSQQLAAMIAEKAKMAIGSGEKIWVVVDEAQKCPLMFDQVKMLYDQYKDQQAIKFILSGSGYLSLHALSAESLAGRIELHYLQEFNLRETGLLAEEGLPLLSIFDEINDGNPIEKLLEIHATLLPFKPLLEEKLQEQLCWGGLPEVLSLSQENDKIIYLNNYLQTYLEKDVRDINTITDLPRYQQLMEILALQTGSVRDDARILEVLGGTRDTLKKYRYFLEATLLYREVYPYIGAPLRRLIKSPKGYLQNNGLISVLTGFTQLQQLEMSGLIGHRFENWFLKELVTWLARDPRRSHIHYWRTTGGMEVDFVVDRKPMIFAFEATYSSKIENKKIKNLKTLMQEASTAAWGYYIYRGNFAIDEQNRICFIPAWLVG